MAKLVVVGIDGASFNFLKPMIEKGELPNLEKLMASGCYGTLKSQLPPLSCPAWKCYSTGKSCGRLGAYGWVNVDCKNKRMSINTGGKMKGPELWDYLSNEGKKVCIINVPLTYPPKKVNGYLVSGPPPGKADGYTFPRELQQEIEGKFGYRSYANLVPVEQLSKQLEEDTIAVVKSRFDLALDKVKEVDFVHLTIAKTDPIMHFHWNTKLMKRLYRCIDEEIGLLWKAAGKDCDFIVMSDHGFRAIDTFFYGNHWLKQQGLLFEKRTLGDVFRALGISRDDLFKVVNKLHLLWLVKKCVPRALRKSVKSSHGEIAGGEETYLIDWKKTKAIAMLGGVFYINREGRAREEIRDKLKDGLSGLRNPKTGEPIVEKIFTREEIYSSGKIASAPDLVALAKPGIEIRGGLGGQSMFSEKTPWKAAHILDGMFVFNGKSFASLGKMQEASLLDLLPTVLHLFGCRVPTDVDGTVLKGLFKKGSKAVQSEIQHRQPLAGAGEEAAGEERAGESQEKTEDELETERELRRLGYLK